MTTSCRACCVDHSSPAAHAAAQVGSSVGKFKVGDRAAVGCMVGSCGRCVACGVSREAAIMPCSAALLPDIAVPL